MCGKKKKKKAWEYNLAVSVPLFGYVIYTIGLFIALQFPARDLRKKT